MMNVWQKIKTLYEHYHRKLDNHEGAKPSTPEPEEASSNVSGQIPSQSGSTTSGSTTGTYTCMTISMPIGVNPTLEPKIIPSPPITDQTKYTDIMIDIETLGTTAGCVITSIAAVTFNLDRVAIPELGLDGIDSVYSDCFYKYVDVDSSLDDGYSITASTLRFWADQDLKSQLKGDIPIGQVLQLFINWFYLNGRSFRDCRIWSNGASFDIPILEYAFQKEGKTSPWKYSNVRCMRTLRAQFPHIKSEQPSNTKHDALADALAQAEQTRKFLIELNKLGLPI